MLLLFLQHVVLHLKTRVNNACKYRVCCLQNEKSFQRQPTVFLNRKKGLGGKRRKPLRYHREVGLGFKTPREVCLSEH